MGFMPSSNSAASMSTNPKWFEMGPKDNLKTPNKNYFWFSPSLVPLLDNFFLLTILIYLCFTLSFKCFTYWTSPYTQTKFFYICSPDSSHSKTTPFVPDASARRPFGCCGETLAKKDLYHFHPRLDIILYISPIFYFVPFLWCSVAPCYY